MKSPVLLYVQWRSRKHRLAVSGEYETYQAMLAYVVEHKKEFTWPYDFLFVISTGNDIYDNVGMKVWSIDSHMSEKALRAETGIREFLYEAVDLFDVIGLVFGGTSDIWQYSGLHGRVYDRVVEEVLESRTMNSFQYVSSGEVELSTLDAYDLVGSIGHVDVRVYEKVARAMVSWIREIVDIVGRFPYWRNL